MALRISRGSVPVVQGLSKPRSFSTNSLAMNAILSRLAGREGDRRLRGSLLGSSPFEGGPQPRELGFRRFGPLVRRFGSLVRRLGPLMRCLGPLPFRLGRGRHQGSVGAIEPHPIIFRSFVEALPEAQGDADLPAP